MHEVFRSRARFERQVELLLNLRNILRLRSLSIPHRAYHTSAQPPPRLQFAPLHSSGWVPGTGARNGGAEAQIFQGTNFGASCAVSVVLRRGRYFRTHQPEHDSLVRECLEKTHGSKPAERSSSYSRNSIRVDLVEQDLATARAARAPLAIELPRHRWSRTIGRAVPRWPNVSSRALGHLSRRTVPAEVSALSGRRKGKYRVSSCT